MSRIIAKSARSRSPSAYTCFDCGVSEAKSRLSVLKVKDEGVWLFRRFCKKCLNARRKAVLDYIEQITELPRDTLEWIHSYYGKVQTKRGGRLIPLNVSVGTLAVLWKAQGGKCALTGRALALSTPSESLECASLDRIDSAKGYSTGNIQWVCYAINQMKWDLSVGEFGDWCKAVVIHALESTS